jgi:hypothetical protein
MRLFKVADGTFTEYKEADFKGEHREKTLESWLEQNPDAIVEDGMLLIIGRQVKTDLNSYIDLLALDRTGNTVVIELKRDRTPRDVIAQALEYASFVEHIEYDPLEAIYQQYSGNEGESLSEYHRTAFKLTDSEAISFNKDQRIVIIGSNISSEIRQTALFLRRKGIRVTCIEFAYFKTEREETLLSYDIVVGKEGVGRSRAITTQTLPRVDKDTFLASLDQFGRPIFTALLQVAETFRLPIHWGSKGFSLNVDIHGIHTAIAFGYPPASSYGQTIYTAFYDIQRKVPSSEALVASFHEQFEATGLFVPIGQQLEQKLVIVSPLSESEIRVVVDLFTELAHRIQEIGENS